MQSEIEKLARKIADRIAGANSRRAYQPTDPLGKDPLHRIAYVAAYAEISQFFSELGGKSCDVEQLRDVVKRYDEETDAAHKTMMKNAFDTATRKMQDALKHRVK